jgi:hypothetical protein
MNFKSFCERHIKNRYELEIIDLTKNHVAHHCITLKSGSQRFIFSLEGDV